MKNTWTLFSICCLGAFLCSFRADLLYDFRLTYQRDITEIHTDFGNSTRSELRIFEQFFNPPLSRFKYKNRTIDGITTLTWTSTTGDLRRIRIIQCAIPIDTIAEITDIQTGEVTERTPVKGTFHFKVYVFDKQSSPKSLIYITSPDSGLQYCVVDGRSFGPAREFIELGIEEALVKLKEEVVKTSGVRL